MPALIMRILYLHQFFMTRAGIGGTRSYEFARRFVQQGHQVTMVTAGDGGRRTEDGIEVVSVPAGFGDYVRATKLGYGRRGDGVRALRGGRHSHRAAGSPAPT